MVAGLDAASSGVAEASSLLSASPMKLSYSPTKDADNRIRPCESIEEYASELVSDMAALMPASSEEEQRDEPSVPLTAGLEEVERAAGDERAPPEEEARETEPRPAVVGAKPEEHASPEPVPQEPIEPASTAAVAKDSPPSSHQPEVADYSPPVEQPPPVENSPAAEQDDIVAEPTNAEDSTKVSAEKGTDKGDLESTTSKKKDNKSSSSKSMSNISRRTKKLLTKKVPNVFVRAPLSPASAAKLKEAADDSSVVSCASTASRASKASSNRASPPKTARRSLLKKLTSRTSHPKKGATAGSAPESAEESRKKDPMKSDETDEAKSEDVPPEAQEKSAEPAEVEQVITKTAETEIEETIDETEVEADQKRPADLPTDVVAGTNEAVPSPMASDEPITFFEMLTKKAEKYCAGITTNLCGDGLLNVEPACQEVKGIVSADGQTKEKGFTGSTQMCGEREMATMCPLSPLSIATERVSTLNKSGLESLENVQASVTSIVFPLVSECIENNASKGGDGGDTKPTPTSPATNDTQHASAKSSAESAQPTNCLVDTVPIDGVTVGSVIAQEADKTVEVAKQSTEDAESREQTKEIIVEIVDKPAELPEAAEAERSTGKK